MPILNSTGKTFNLVDQPWIPVAGEHAMRSLLEFFTGPAPKRLSGNAVDKIVLFRFLLSIVHASSSIPDESAWHALTPEKIAENARNYLTDHKSLFDLYDPERPFLQFPLLRGMGKDEVKKRCVWTMRVNYSDNQSILSSWQIKRELTDDEIARFLLRMNCAALASKIYENDILLSPCRIPEKRENCVPGKLLGTGLYGYLHSYLLGNDLWESLHLNLLTENEINQIGAYKDGLGRPFWEEMPKGEDDSRARSYKNSYQGRIFPVDKCVLLTDNGKKVIKTDGIPYASGIDAADPALTIYKDNKGLVALRAKVAVRPWRELASLLNFLNSKENPYPFFLSRGLKHLYGTNIETVRFWVGGVEISNQSGGQQIRKTNDYVESEFLLPLNQLKTTFLNNYSDLMQRLDGCSKSLRDAVKNYYVKLCENESQNNEKEKEKQKRKQTCPLAENQANLAETKFWERMEPRGQLIIGLAATDHQNEKEKEDEKKLWRDTVLFVYNEFCPNTTARQMTAWVEAKPKFNRKKGKSKNGK